MKEVSSGVIYKLITAENDFDPPFPHVKYMNGVVAISNLEIKGKVIFDENFIIKKNVYFDNCTFEEIEFDNCFFKQFWLKNCIVDNNLVVKNGYFEEWFWFNDCDFNSSFIIRNASINNLLIDNVKAEKNFKIEGGNLSKVTFIPRSENDILKISGLLTFIEELVLKPNNGIKIIAEKTFIKNIFCEGYLNNDSRIDLSDIRVNFGISFENVKNDGKIYLKGFLALADYPIIFDDKSIDIIEYDIFGEDTRRIKDIIKSNRITSIGKLYNNKTTPEHLREIILKKYFSSITRLGEKKNSDESFFKLKESSIGYIELIDFDLNQYINIIIESSDLTDIKLINSFIPTNKKLKSIDNSFLNHYSIYNSLYISAKNQNNIKDQNKYFQASQKYLLKNLNQNFWKNLPSILSNLTSKLFSNYGESWLKSLIVTFVLAIFTYGLYLLSHENITLNLSFNGLIYYYEHFFSHLPEFINPTHNTHFLDSKDFNPGAFSGWIDFIGRIVVGIGIYETIKSFRKYVN